MYEVHRHFRFCLDDPRRVLQQVAETGPLAVILDEEPSTPFDPVCEIGPEWDVEYGPFESRGGQPVRD